ncbi:MAG: DbpA RNA binding domain-containing protein, partial [Jatrophihabitans sp.]
EPRQHRLLKTIEKVTKNKIAMETLPTVADLRARRLELTRGTLAEILREDDYEQYRVVVDNLTDEYDLVQVAMAAVKMAHEAGGSDEDLPDIPVVRPEADSPSRPQRDRPKSGPAGPGSSGSSGPSTTIFVSLGHAAKIRPQDLVGAIANETSLSGRQIGAIEITHNFSTVEIPKSAEAEVIAKLKATLIKGRKARVERYKPPAERKGKE